MNANWVPALSGSVAEVLVLQEALEANAIQALAPEVEHLDIATLGGSAYAPGVAFSLDIRASQVRMA